jgi:hypothetical protein
MENMSDQLNADWGEWKRIQHSMKMEGWTIHDNELEKIASDFLSSGYASLPEQIVREAEESGRPLAEVAKEIFEKFRQQYRK